MSQEHLGVKIHDYTLDFTDFIAHNSADQRVLLDQYRASLRADFDAARYSDPAQGWYRTAFLERFVFMYDHDFYDRETQSYRIDELLDQGEKEFGGYELLCLWQSYPRLGIDHRNQYDYYRDMPGGLEGLRKVVERAHQRNVHVLLNYNPWDIDTRREGKSDGEALADLLRSTGADGLFLDTISKSDPDFHHVIENVRPGIIFDPERMPKREEAQLITGSWQQFGTMEPPGLITIRWLEPRHSLRGINRVSLNRIRQIGINFFYGYGMVLWENIFGWWNPYSYDEMRLVRKYVHLLRTHQDAFTDMNWQPFVPTLVEGVFANQWSAGEKTVYTFFNRNAEAVSGPILAIPTQPNRRYDDVWAGGSVTAAVEGEQVRLSFRLEAQSPGCIIVQPEGSPAPSFLSEGTLQERNQAVEKALDDLDLHHRLYVPRAEEHRTVSMEAYHARPVEPTEKASLTHTPAGMALIPGGRFVMNVRHNVFHWMEGACYGDISQLGSKNHPTQYFWLPPFFLDITEVTNADYKQFLQATHYQPKDLTRFLDHWLKPEKHLDEPFEWNYAQDEGDLPVIWVDLEDARAYARWAGKRLPREEEWQYAAEGGKGYLWPWGNEYNPELCNGSSGHLTPVKQYPLGMNSFGCYDMAGNVWEWTESERDDGHTRYAILRGGSHLRVKGSIWYTSSGAQPNDAHEKILLLYPGLDRCSTVGFRCVKDAA